MKENNTKRLFWFAIIVGLLSVPLQSIAAGFESLAAGKSFDTGNTAWMIVATALVLLMTIPGLALFYAGMVRSKNVLSVLMQCFAITAVMSILWYMFGYSLSAKSGSIIGLPSIIGGAEGFFLSGLKIDSIADAGHTIPESVFITFQMTFAIITPALIVGAFAERMKFLPMMIFMILWSFLVYYPIWHMVWGGGLIAGWGAWDFAGGTVVHINAGIAGLVLAIMLGKRKGYPGTMMAPHNLTLTVIGASLLWVGWFGFNAGSQLAADGGAGMAMLVTQLASAAAAFTWMAIEWVKHGKPSVLGVVTGAIAGLVAITPASGYVAPLGALIIGLSAGIICFLASTVLKRMFKYDDSLDVFGVHAVGGIVGAILTGVFGHTAMGGFKETKLSVLEQTWIQTQSVLVTIGWCAGFSIVIFLVVKIIFGARVSEEQETEGLDIALHDEKGYNL